MNANNINKWLTLGANLGVLTGIILVAYEINQSTLATRAELISSHQDRWVTMDLSWQDKEFAGAWAKAMENPETLTVTEMIQLNGFMWSYIDHIDTNRVLWNLGILDDPMPSQENLISTNAGIFFGNKFAQAWLVENRALLGARTMEIIDRELTSVSTDDNLEFYMRIKTRLGN